MPKTGGEEPMVMAITWMSRINKAGAQPSKPNPKTEPETEVKKPSDTPTTNPKTPKPQNPMDMKNWFLEYQFSQNTFNF